MCIRWDFDKHQHYRFDRRQCTSFDWRAAKKEHTRVRNVSGKFPRKTPPDMRKVVTVVVAATIRPCVWRDAIRLTGFWFPDVTDVCHPDVCVNIVAAQWWFLTISYTFLCVGVANVNVEFVLVRATKWIRSAAHSNGCQTFRARHRRSRFIFSAKWPLWWQCARTIPDCI